MNYKANITNKELVNEKVVVTVEYATEDLSSVITDKIESNQKQDADWPLRIIERKLFNLNSLPTVMSTVKIGTVDTVTDPQNDPNKTAKELYAEKLARFAKFVTAIGQGFTDDQNIEFKALHQELKDGFITDYLDLF